MKKTLALTAAMIAVALLPFGYLLYIWPSVPQRIPLHFNFKFEPDRFGSKEELWAPVSILAGVSVLLYFLLTNLHRFDPKRKDAALSSGFHNMAAVVVIFLAVLNVMIIASAARGSVILHNFLFPVIGVFFAFLGNYMNNIKPNYIAGFRLPWTLSNDDNWRKTHHLAGKLWFAGGLLIAVVGFIIPGRWMLPVFIGIVIIISAIPAFYSYRLFKSKSHVSQ
jgi:uncharacterized membrane protein